ncbi:MAG TPA: hypothetical protein DIT93_07630 [Pelagibacterium sp.]|nr:hypothetical protein [Pelagibacterium sp.]HCO54872.1 hypothetical protein [Pelagibacterium sp.]
MQRALPGRNIGLADRRHDCRPTTGRPSYRHLTPIRALLCLSKVLPHRNSARTCFRYTNVRVLAETANKAAVADLRAANADVRDRANQKEHAAFLIADREFHHAIFRHADILELWPILRRHSGHLDRLRMLNLPNIGMERVVALHEKIIDGIAAEDPAAAIEAMREHLSKTLSMLDWVGQQYPEYLEI